jgi:hypothetical protein
LRLGRLWEEFTSLWIISAAAVGFTEEMIEAVEKWRPKQKPVPNLSEAIDA